MAVPFKSSNVQDDTQRVQRLARRFAAMYEEARTWRSHYQELSDYLSPRKGRYLENTSADSDNDGSKINDNIINATPTVALGVLAAGIQGGLTSPSRPWFRLTLGNRQVADSHNVKIWLHDVRKLLLHIFQRSNFYAATHNLYYELGLFGTAAMLIEPDLETVIRCRPFTAGEYFLSLDNHGRPDALFRRFSMTTHALIEEFGEDNVSRAAQDADKKPGLAEKRWNVIHCIQPSKDVAGQYDSEYYQETDNDQKLLRRSKYDSRPFVAPRWFVDGSDVYGRSPAMLALGDIKMLQRLETLKLQAEDKRANPPMVAHPDLKKLGGGNILPGGINWIDTMDPKQSFFPAYQVAPDTRGISLEIERVENRIGRIFHNDIFLLMVANRKSMTATEAEMISSEKMLQLGPVIQRVQEDLLDKAIIRTFQVAESLGLVPPPPAELNGQDLRVEYQGLLAQIQKMVDTAGIEQLVAFASNLAAAQAGVGQTPEVLDMLNLDEAVGEYAERIGVAPSMLRDTGEVNRIRQARAVALAQQQQMQQVQQAADIGSKLSQMPVGEDTMLDHLMSGAGAR